MIYSKDARLPVQLQRAMAAEAEAAREARAKVIAAEGEQKASRALKEASEVIAESSSALQLRYLQVYILMRAFFSKLRFFPNFLAKLKAFTVVFEATRMLKSKNRSWATFIDN